MYSAKLPGQPNKFPIGKGKMCIAPSMIFLGKLSPQYYWMFCSFVLFYFFMFFPILPAWSSISFVADRDISRQIHPQKAPWLQVDCCKRNTCSTFHLKEKERIISATYKPGDPLQKAHPKSAVCCCCAVRSTLSMLLLLMYFLSPAFTSTSGTCRSCNLLPLKQLLPIQLVVGVIELWFLCVVTST